MSQAKERIRFACNRCDQLLSVGTSRIGREVNCPKCDEPQTVPSAEVAALDLADRKNRKAEAEAASSTGDANEFSQFEVYDDETEFIFENDEDEGYYYGRAVDHTKVAVPRSILYAQGGLLAVVAIFAFAFGWFVGAATSRPVAVEVVDHTPKVIRGDVTFVDAGDRVRPDAGSVVILLPEESRPAEGEKVAVEGLRPDDPSPEETHRGLQQIQVLGGAYTRTDTEGRFRLQVPRGNYFMLVISGNKSRPSSEELDRESLAQMGRYFVPATELIGGRKFSWSQERIASDRELPISFENVN